MKQHITTTQLKSLSDKAKLRLQSWYYDRKEDGDLVTYAHPCKWKPVVLGLGAIQGDPLPLLSIGQMIEFLDKHNRGHEAAIILPLLNDINSDHIDVKAASDWCDCLWEAVKKVLQTTNSSDTEET